MPRSQKLKAEKALRELINGDGEWCWSSDHLKKMLLKHGSHPVLTALHAILEDKTLINSHVLVEDVVKMARSLGMDFPAFPPPDNESRAVIHLWTQISDDGYAICCACNQLVKPNPGGPPCGC